MAQSKQQQMTPSLLFLDDTASHSCIHTAAVTSACDSDPRFQPVIAKADWSQEHPGSIRQPRCLWSSARLSNY